MEFSSFIRGILIGFSIAAPVGPIGILCIRRTIANGRISGLVTGLGAATADAFYGSLAAMGLSFLILFLINQQTWLQLIGGAFLCYLGIKTFLEKPTPAYLNSSSIISPGKENKNFIRSRLSDYTSTLFLTLTNPLTILSFTAIFAGIGINQLEASKFQGLMLVVGVFLGSTAWWLLLTTLASAFKERFVSEKSLLWINRISGVIILGFGVIALIVSLVKVAKNNTSQPPSAVLGLRNSAHRHAWVCTCDRAGAIGFSGRPRSPPGIFDGMVVLHGKSHICGREGFRLSAHLFPALSCTSHSNGGSRIGVGGDPGVYGSFRNHRCAGRAAPCLRAAFTRCGWIGRITVGAFPYLVVWLGGEPVIPDSLQAHRRGKWYDLNLTLEDLKGPVLHGNQGYSQKSAGSGQASMYYSVTRLESSGTLQIDDQLFEVTGLSWMDHEFSTSALSAEQVGWDWFSFQLDDGSEVMLFQIRQQDGSIDPFSSGTIVYPDGTLKNLSVDDFSVEVQKTSTALALLPHIRLDG